MTTTWTSKIPGSINRQVPQAIAGTLNALARGAAEDARAAAGVELNVKSRTLLKNFIFAPVSGRATKARLKARVLVGAPKGARADRGNILTQQEEGGLKTPTAGRSVAMPSRDIRKPGSKRDVIRGTELRNFRPFRAQSFIDSRQQIVAGQKNSFLITLKKGKGRGKKMLLQRYGRGQKSVRGLWIFVPQTRLTPKLRFNRTVSAHVKQNLTRAFRASMSQAIASARALKGTTQSTRIG